MQTTTWSFRIKKSWVDRENKNHLDSFNLKLADRNVLCMKSTGVCSHHMISRNTNDPSTSIVLGTLGFFFECSSWFIVTKKLPNFMSTPKMGVSLHLNGCSWQISQEWFMKFHDPDFFKSTNPQKTHQKKTGRRRSIEITGCLKKVSLFHGLL